VEQSKLIQTVSSCGNITQVSLLTVFFSADPLNFMESNYYAPTASTSANSFGYERKPKVVLRDREMFLARLLRENNIRTMDIAKMMKISERSVTRLLAKSRELEVIEYEADVVAEVDRLLAEKDEILNAEMMIEETVIDQAENDPQAGKDDSKRQICSSLLAMNVKLKDIAKMLDVSEKTIQRWKAKIVKHQQHEGSEDEAAGHSVFRNLLPKQEAEELEEYGDYE
jgi:transposase